MFSRRQLEASDCVLQGPRALNWQNSFEQGDTRSVGRVTVHSDLHTGTDYFFLTLSVVPFWSLFVSNPLSFLSPAVILFPILQALGVTLGESR